MGSVRVTVALSAASEAGAVEEIDVLVDSGMMLSVFPTGLLEGLGVRKIGRRLFREPGGEVLRSTGTAIVSYGGEVAGITVVFGDSDCPAVIGLTALASLGFTVDSAAGGLVAADTWV